MRRSLPLAAATAVAMLLDPAAAVAGPGTDFGIAMQAPTTAGTGEDFSYAITVSNTGRSRSATTMTDSVPAQLTVRHVTATGATCSTSGNDVSCTTTKLSPGESATVSITVAATQSGTVTNTAVLADDANAADNTASTTTEVTAAPAEPGTDGPAEGTAAPPYDSAESSEGAHADAATGEVSLAFSDCRIEYVEYHPLQPNMTCSGEATVHQAFTTSGTVPRPVIVTGTFDVAQARLSAPDGEIDVAVAVRAGPGLAEYHRCEQTVVGVAAGRLQLEDTRIAVTCVLVLSEPRPLLQVSASVDGAILTLGTGHFDGVVSSITVSS